MKVENKEDGTKVIELTEKEQADLFCVAMQLTNFWEDVKDYGFGDHKKNKHFLNPTVACKFCKYRVCKYHGKLCHMTHMGLPIYDHFETMTKLTGVTLEPMAGFRKFVEQGKASFLEEDFNYSADHSTRKLKKNLTK